MSTALQTFSDHEIVNRTRELAARERKLTLSLLLHLNEVERRQIHLTLGHASLFVYCTEELHYSSSAAKRRICTARCIARYPEALALLEANEVNLSTITQVARILEPDNASTILRRIRGKSQREVEAVVAEYEPLAALPRDRARTVVVRVPVEPVPPPTPTTPLAATAMSDVASPTESSQDRNGPEPERPDDPPMKFERHVAVQFTAKELVMNKLEHVRSLASHRLPANAPLVELIEFLADYFTHREDPKARHQRREAKARATREVNTTADPRQIPASVRDEVYVRNNGRCTFTGTHSKQCGSAHTLQLDQ
jgi:hypothetical protein